MLFIALFAAVALAQDINFAREIHQGSTWTAPSTSFLRALKHDSSAYLKDGNTVLFSPICGYEAYFEPKLGRCRNVKTGRFVAAYMICEDHSKYDARVRRCRHKENGRFTSRVFGPATWTRVKERPVSNVFQDTGDRKKDAALAAKNFKSYWLPESKWVEPSASEKDYCVSCHKSWGKTQKDLHAIDFGFKK